MQEQRLEAIYRELPTIECQKKCAESCGPIMMSRVEWRRITNHLGFTPRAADPDLEAIKAGDLRSLICPMLDRELCTVYALRPLICRLWGIAEGMECPWGCRPSRLLSRAEAREFHRRVEEVSR